MPENGANRERADVDSAAIDPTTDSDAATPDTASLAASAPDDDYDSPWKLAMEKFFPLFLLLLFPHVYEAIDWSIPPVFLNSELEKITRDARTGKRYVDRLVKVYLKAQGKASKPACLLIHVEVQSQRDYSLPERLFEYNYRAFDHLRMPVITLAVLADGHKSWRPQRYEYGIAGARTSIEFLTSKLLDFSEDLSKLEASDNPFALVVLAHLQTRATRKQAKTRAEWKQRIVRRLYELGMEPALMLEMWRVIDWMMELPPELVKSFKEFVRTEEEGMSMPYVTSIERLAKEEGAREGRKEGAREGRVQTFRTAIVEILDERFGAAAGAVQESLDHIDSAVRLRRLLRKAVSSPSLAEFQKLTRP